MNLFVPFLLLAVPGIIAVSVHHKQLIHMTRDNWQSVTWEYLIYSFAIVFVTHLFMYISYPRRTVSFSPWMTDTVSHTLMPSFVVKYIFFAVIGAVCLPMLWKRRHGVLSNMKKRKSFKISDDE